jgi:hypothetical protein
MGLYQVLVLDPSETSSKSIMPIMPRGCRARKFGIFGFIRVSRLFESSCLYLSPVASSKLIMTEERDMTEEREERYTARLEDGGEASYVIRGLNEEEVQAWSQFCASVFAYKANPPPASQFERHYTNDPNRGKASLIRVAFFNGEMVSSCRLFLRTISTGGSTPPLNAGGIGEVCTATTHQRRGLSKVLLQNVIEIMKERQLQVSLLHAAPEFFPVYEKAGGYKCSRSQWSAVTVISPSSTVDKSHSIREAAFPSDTERLCRLHQIYSQSNFAGCIVRSQDYWNQYLSQELANSLFVLTADDQGGLIVAWLSLRLRGDRVQLREFGVDRDIISTDNALNSLLGHAAEKLSVGNEWTLVLPTTVLYQARQDQDQCFTCIDWSSQVPHDDLGWMYKVYASEIPFEVVSGEKRPHLIWPADSF